MGVDVPHDVAIGTDGSNQILAAMAHTAAGAEHDTQAYTSAGQHGIASTLVVVEADVADTEVVVDPATTAYTPRDTSERSSASCSSDVVPTTMRIDVVATGSGTHGSCQAAPTTCRTHRGQLRRQQRKSGCSPQPARRYPRGRQQFFVFVAALVRG